MQTRFFIDTHTHTYLEEFDADRAAMVKRSVDANVAKVLLPNIDLDSIAQVNRMMDEYPDYAYGMMGLHPCSVKENYQEVLNELYRQFSLRNYYGVGEIGLDLYWDTRFFEQQKDAFRQQLQWAKELGLPVSIHTREATEQAIDMVSDLQDGRLKGVFHCFGSTVEHGKKIADLGMYIGIGGVVTYKKSNLIEVLKELGLNNAVLETDAPYLSPIPYRGKRNESAWVSVIAQFIADALEMSVDDVNHICTQNSKEVFFRSIGE